MVVYIPEKSRRSPQCVRTMVFGAVALVTAVAITPFPVPAQPLAMSPAHPFLAGLDTTGTTALRMGDAHAALAILTTQKVRPSDSAYYNFKVGLALAASGNLDKAIECFRDAVRLSALLAAAAYEQIAHLETMLNRPRNALAAYRAALATPVPERYQVELRNGVAGLVATSQFDSSEIAWISPWFAPAPLVDVTVQREVVHRLVADRNWVALDSVITSSLRSSPSAERCSLLTIIPLDSLPKSALPTTRLFEVAENLHRCGKARRARQWLTRAESRPDYPSVLDERKILYLRGMLSYAVGDYTRAIDVLREYERIFGPTPEVVLTIARAYRNSGRPNRAADWYDRHVALYPSHAQTQEILWYRAWQKEDEGHFAAARALYRRLRQQYRTGPRAPEACFREGLLFFREGRYDSALVLWASLQKNYPQSSVVPMVAYWQARACLETGRTSEAMKTLTFVVRYDPLGYYSYRAQDLLRALGDTTRWFSPDTAVSLTRCMQWLDSLSSPPQRTLSPSDSQVCAVGAALLLSGLARQAQWYFDPVMEKYSSNLTIRFGAAVLYQACGCEALAHRAARPLSWRIPPEARLLAPRGVLKVLYPDAFGAAVEREAARYGIPSEMLLGLIRQESAFDPLAVSPAGAVGLMQLLPSTAAAVAGELKEEFHDDSLRVVNANVRYGAAYLCKLLDRFEGSTVLALAGYNAGPPNAQRWYERNKGQDFDLFVENIGYSETRGYVKRVLANYWTYCRIGVTEGNRVTLSLNTAR